VYGWLRTIIIILIEMMLTDITFLNDLSNSMQNLIVLQIVFLGNFRQF